MHTIRICDILPEKVLVSRESARLLDQPVRAALAAVNDALAGESVALDFAEVGGVAPSFLDELIRVLETALGQENGTTPLRIIILNPPTRLSSKFEAVARGHALRAIAQPDGSWLLSDAAG